jgi:hypothetical protein
MEFDRVFNGIIKYINKEIFPGFNDVQDVIARIALRRVVERKQSIKDALTGNGLLKTFAIIDDRGEVDVDGLMNDIRAEISERQKLQIKIPMFGTFSFVEGDVDVLMRYIKEA